jgi:hypothetical protein
MFMLLKVEEVRRIHYSSAKCPSPLNSSNVKDKALMEGKKQIKDDNKVGENSSVIFGRGSR